MPITPPDRGKFELPFATLIVGGVVSILLIVVFTVIANAQEIKYEIRDLIAMFTCGIVSTTLIYHAKNIRLNYEINETKLNFDKEKFEEEKRQKTEEQRNKKILYSFEVTTVWFKPEMAKNVEIARGYILKNREILMRGDIHKVVKEMEENLDTRRAVICVLNYFENLSLMIKNGVVEESSIKQCFKTVFLDYSKVLKRYIDEIQKTSSRYLMNYEQIAKEWEKS